MIENSLAIAKTVLETDYGQFTVVLHQETPYRIISASQGKIGVGVPVVRIHSSCIFSEVFHSLQCDCRDQLDASFSAISKNKDGGVLVYSDQEGRGLGLAGKFRVHDLERMGMDTVESYKVVGRDPELREYGREVGALHDLGVSKKIKLVSGNNDKRAALEKAGYVIEEMIKVIPKRVLDPMAKRELKTKKEVLGYEN